MKYYDSISNILNYFNKMYIILPKIFKLPQTHRSLHPVKRLTLQLIMHYRLATVLLLFFLLSLCSAQAAPASNSTNQTSNASNHTAKPKPPPGPPPVTVASFINDTQGVINAATSENALDFKLAMKEITKIHQETIAIIKALQEQFGRNMERIEASIDNDLSKISSKILLNHQAVVNITMALIDSTE